MAQKIKKMRPKRIDEKNSNSVKIAWIVGAVGLCVLLVAGIAIATSGSNKGGGGIKAQGSVPATTTAPGSTPQTTTPAAPTLTVEQVQVPPLSIYRRRNPFEPLVDEEVLSGPNGTTATGGAGLDVVTVPPQLRTDSNGVPETVSTAITLEGVTKQADATVARISVAGQAFDNIAVGQTFADNYKLLSINGDSSATILFGDERFTIYTGQSIYL
jgi:hypothetical protein